MANSSKKTIRNHAQAHLHSSERLIPAYVPRPLAKIRRVSRDSIKRLEIIIALQEVHLKMTRRESVGNPWQTRRLRASAKDVLQTFKLTLQQIRQSADNLELSWAMLE